MTCSIWMLPVSIFIFIGVLTLASPRGLRPNSQNFLRKKNRLLLALNRNNPVVIVPGHVLREVYRTQKDYPQTSCRSVNPQGIAGATAQYADDINPKANHALSHLPNHLDHMLWSPGLWARRGVCSLRGTVVCDVRKSVSTAAPTVLTWATRIAAGLSVALVIKPGTRSPSVSEW